MYATNAHKSFSAVGFFLSFLICYLAARIAVRLNGRRTPVDKRVPPTEPAYTALLVCDKTDIFSTCKLLLLLLLRSISAAVSWLA